MERTEHLHEIVRPLLEIGRGVVDFVVELIVPEESLELGGAAGMLDRALDDVPTDES